MKKLLFTLSLLTTGFLYAGEDWAKIPIGPFGTLNTRDNSYAIPATQSPDLLNVELTPGGKSVKKRHGYGIAWTLSQTTSPVHGVYDFFDSNGNEVNLFFNDTKITSSVGGATASVIYSTGPFGATYQCTDSLGNAYCTNTNRTTLFKTNGQTVSTISTLASTGTMVATAVTRLAMAGFSDAPSRIDFSADSDFTSWGTGSLGTSPAQFTVNAPGAKITHIVYAFNRLMWFKDTSFGYILIGNQPAQSDWVVKTVSYDVGTNDNSSIYREGILYFRGKDGHIYAFDGYTYQRMTKEISNTVNSAQTKSSNFFIVSSQGDFNAGTSTSSVYADTTTISGILQLNFPDPFSTYRDGTNGTQGVWNTYNTGVKIGTVTSVGGQLNLSIGNNGAGTNDTSIDARTGLLDTFAKGTTYHIEIDTITMNFSTGTQNDSFYLVLTSVTFANPALGTLGPYNTAPNFYVKFIKNYINGNSSTRVFGNPQLTNSNDGNLVVGTLDYDFPCFVDLYLSTSNYSLTVSGKKNSSSFSGTHTFGDRKMYAYIAYSEIQADTHTLIVDNFGVAPVTMTFTSNVYNSANLASWDAFVANATNNGGTHNYYIRGSTFSFLTSSTYAWTSITSGALPSIATAAYLQIRDDIGIGTWTSTPQLYDMTQNWFEGSASDKMYATYFDDKLMFSLTIGTAATTNNRILLYDMLNQGWLLWDLPSNGFYIKANKLYFGSSNSGYVYKYGDVENDNGGAINSYWKSKDYFGGDPFTTQELANISMEGKTVANSSMTVTYTLNGSSSTSYTMPLSNNKLFAGVNKNLPAGTIGSTFNIKMGNNAADQPWEIFAVQIGIREKTWVPGGP